MLTSSVLIPSFQRGPKLRTCLLSLSNQTQLPDEVIVVWQGDDVATRDLAESCRAEVRYPLKVLHNPICGIVPAENFALDASVGQIILLIDDDAIAPSDWVAKHVAHYERNRKCGAVGGSAVNFHEGVEQPRRTNEPIGLLTWYGKQIGNMYDHIDEWKARSPRRVNHLVGYNMSLRRAAFDRFEDALKSYWQKFESDACFQCEANGYEVWFDFSNVVEHHPTSMAYKPGRSGDLYIKVYHGAFNDAFILSKFSPWYLRPPRLAYIFLVGITNAPGLVAFAYAILKHGNPLREVKILLMTWKYRIMGWIEGAKARKSVELAKA